MPWVATHVGGLEVLEVEGCNPQVGYLDPTQHASLASHCSPRLEENVLSQPFTQAACRAASLDISLRLDGLALSLGLGIAGNGIPYSGLGSPQFHGSMARVASSSED